MKWLMILLCLVLLSACDIQWVTPKLKYNHSLNYTVQTNLSQANTGPEYVEGNDYYFVAEDGITIFIGGSSVVIDPSGYTAADLLRQHNKDLEAVIITTEGKATHAKYLMLSDKPAVIFDNGIPDSLRAEYLKYQERLNLSHIVLKVSKVIAKGGMQIEFFVPYEERGFVLEREQNSIPVRVNNLLYMSDCYGECETVVNTHVPYLVLANGGKCNATNSMEFVLETGAHTILGEDDLCEDMVDLKYFGVEFRKINGIEAIKHE